MVGRHTKCPANMCSCQKVLNCPKININLLSYARTDRKTSLVYWSLEGSEELENFSKYKTQWFQNVM